MHMRPIVIVNFKTYPQATGEKAVKLAQLCADVAKTHRVDMRVAVQMTDIALVAKAVDIPVYAQHTDAVAPGKTTGWVTAQALKAAGASGTLLNHAEHRTSTQNIRFTTPYLRKAKLDIVVIAESLHKLQEFEQHVDADLFVIEPPELIAGEVSVSMARPDIVGHAVHSTKKPLLVGAGVRDYEDLSMALELGAKGVMLASHIVPVRDQRRALLKLLTARGR
jgi:triosephosphate isomerase (TIM)